jgi:hypothetical protein
VFPVPVWQGPLAGPIKFDADRLSKEACTRCGELARKPAEKKEKTGNANLDNLRLFHRMLLNEAFSAVLCLQQLGF